MAEIRTANIAKMVTKQAGRAKEKLLQNLGKADKTTDEIFEEHLLNFNQQQANATRLQKDISNYIRCIKAIQTASKNLMDSLSEVYEPQWTGQDLLTVQGQKFRDAVGRFGAQIVRSGPHSAQHLPRPVSRNEKED